MQVKRKRPRDCCCDPGNADEHVLKPQSAAAPAKYVKTMSSVDNSKCSIVSISPLSHYVSRHLPPESRDEVVASA